MKCNASNTTITSLITAIVIVVVTLDNDIITIGSCFTPHSTRKGGVGIITTRLIPIQRRQRDDLSSSSSFSTSPALHNSYRHRRRYVINRHDDNINHVTRGRRICVEMNEGGDDMSITTTMTKEEYDDEYDNDEDGVMTNQYLETLILWRGEKANGYSDQFRQLEFSNAVAALLHSEKNQTTTATTAINPQLSFTNAVSSSSALQYVSSSLAIPPSPSILINATQRCSHIRSMFHIIARGSDYDTLSRRAIRSSHPSLSHDINKNKSWSIRVRSYDNDDARYGRRYGKNVRSSLRKEKRTVLALKDWVVERLPHNVDLTNPQRKFYVLEGLGKEDEKVLAIMVAKGLKTYSYHPTNRLCQTNTPLCPITAFAMTNMARINSKTSVLDPYVGSGTLLLAASHLKCRKTVGIDVAHGGHVNFDNVVLDFTTRGLVPPLGLIRGDCHESEVRWEALECLKRQETCASAHADADASADADREGFDVIVTDPPYGIREKMDRPPLVDLITGMAHDRRRETNAFSLLKKGGRLVAFVPVEGENKTEKDVWEGLPSKELLNDVGLTLQMMVEQPLNKRLSRWLVVFDMVK